MENFTHDMTDVLLVKYLASEATPPEQEMVEQWINESEDNLRYFQQLQSIWSGSLDAASISHTDENKAWQKFQRRIRKSGQGGNSNTGFGWWRIAAAIVLVAGAAWFTSTFLFKATKDPGIVQIVAAAEVKRDTLPDGSITTINKNSTITYPSYFKGKTRTVALQGEAFFNVKPDKKKPFVIEVNDVSIRVLGTSFNVKSKGDSTEVIVETGVVEVSGNGKILQLKAGERAVFSETDTVATKEITGDQLYRYYVSRTFVCDNTPLWKLVEKLNEAYEVDIRIQRPELRKLPLTVTFNDESLDMILDIISQTLMLKVTRKDNQIILH